MEVEERAQSESVSSVPAFLVYEFRRAGGSWSWPAAACYPRAAASCAGCAVLPLMVMVHLDMITRAPTLALLAAVFLSCVSRTGGLVASSTPTPAEVLSAMMREVEARALDAERVQGMEGCPPCVTAEAQACCSSCACVHGTCNVAGMCVCDTDWFGDSCDFHVLSHGHFLPHYDPRERTPRRQEQAHAFSRGAARLVDTVDQQQHAHGCADGAGASRCRPQHVVMEGRGLGSWVHHMVGALTHTLAHNLTLVPRYPYDYFLHDGCPTRSHSQMQVEDAGCYFEPVVSGVSGDLIWRESDRSMKLSHFWNSYLPPPSTAATFGPAAGIFWWTVKLVNYIMSPNRRLDSMIRRYKSMLGWPTRSEGRVLGVHIRHGDACASWRKGVMHHSELMPNAFCLEFSAHVLPAIAAMVRAYNATHVFVATDDPAVLEHIRQSPNQMQKMPCGRIIRWLGNGCMTILSVPFVCSWRAALPSSPTS